MSGTRVIRPCEVQVPTHPVEVNGEEETFGATESRCYCPLRRSPVFLQSRGAASAQGGPAASTMCSNWPRITADPLALAGTPNGQTILPPAPSLLQELSREVGGICRSTAARGSRLQH